MGALPAFKPHRNGVQISGAIIDEPIELTNARIPCDVRLQHCQFKKALFRGKDNEAAFGSMKVAGHAIFDDASFEGRVNVRFADFGSLSLSNASLPKVDGLSQLHYKYISAGSGADSHEALLTLAKSLPYNGSWYSRLEDFF